MDPIPAPKFALSIKQPWATLVVLGLKTIEIRRWTTAVRGRIYLHAGRIADDRLEGWQSIPEEHFALTSRRGGIIGAVDLVECLTYSSPRDFGKDRQLHLNDPSWFLPPRLFGFRFANPAIVPFRAYPGQVKFFPVPPLPGKAAAMDVKRSEPAAKTAKKKVVSFELEPTRKTVQRSAKSR